jgi:hypothetical protein
MTTLQTDEPSLNPDNTKSNPDNTKSNEEDKENSSNVIRYTVGIFFIAFIILLIWYAYWRFVESSISEPFVEETIQERDDPLADFNLHSAIKDLERMQKKVIGTLSQHTGI